MNSKARWISLASKVKVIRRMSTEVEKEIRRLMKEQEKPARRGVGAGRSENGTPLGAPAVSGHGEGDSGRPDNAKAREAAQA